MNLFLAIVVMKTLKYDLTADSIRYNMVHVNDDIGSFPSAFTIAALKSGAFPDQTAGQTVPWLLLCGRTPSILTESQPGCLTLAISFPSCISNCVRSNSSSSIIRAAACSRRPKSSQALALKAAGIL